MRQERQSEGSPQTAGLVPTNLEVCLSIIQIEIGWRLLEGEHSGWMISHFYSQLVASFQQQRK
jgi:hypothetical protein